MKNSRICPNCKSENHFIEYTCLSCKHYLRDKIVNINLWSEFWSLLETPFEAFKRILLAEHKNYLVLLLLTILLKLFVNSVIIQAALETNRGITLNLISNLFIESGYIVLFLIIYSVVINRLINISGVKSKFKNILSIYVFALWPYAFGLAILTSVEYALFGNYFFTYEISPFELKPGATYMLLILEILVFVSGIVYAFIGIKVQTNSKIFSLITAFLFGSGLLAVNAFLPLLNS